MDPPDLLRCKTLWTQLKTQHEEFMKRPKDANGTDYIQKLSHLTKCAASLEKPTLFSEARDLRVYFYHKGACLSNVLDNTPGLFDERTAAQYMVHKRLDHQALFRS